LRWEEWFPKYLGCPAEKSLDLGCGSGSRSLTLWKIGSSKNIEGTDVSKERVAEGERRRQELGAPGSFWVSDMNSVQLTTNYDDLIFSCHSFHHFLNLEHIMEQVSQALTPNGLFVLEEFVVPTQFQWTDVQMKIAQELLSTLPPSLRTYRNGTIKKLGGRPTPADVIAASPFEAIRSAEILPLFQKFFEIVFIRKLGGPIQMLLYNDILHNFCLEDTVGLDNMKKIFETEDQMIDSGQLPSDFMLLIGKRKN